VAIEVVDRYTKIWKPHDRQQRFIEIPDTVFEALYGGAAGGGKSELLIMLPILRGWHLHPRFHGILFRETFPQLEESLIPRADVYYKLAGATFNEAKHYWRFPSGAVIRASYLEKEKHARRHDTTEYHYAAFDELTSFKEFVYKFLTSRVRSSEADLPPIVRSASNPGNQGHVWVRERFVDPAREGGKIIFDRASKTYRIFIPAKLEDNPYLNDADPGYAWRLEILPEAERRAKKDGDWYVFSGQVFSEWRDFHRSSEPANALHVIQPFEIPTWWPRILAVDWGFTAKTWAGWAAVSPDSRCFLYREYAKDKQNIETWGADLARLSQHERSEIHSVVLDPSAWAHRGDKFTIAQQFEAASGFKPSQADNDRLGGKMLLHAFLRWQPRPPKYIPAEGYSDERAAYIYRNFGQDALAKYQDVFTVEPPETNLPRLQVFDTCKEFIKTIPICTYDDKDGEVVEDVREFNGDDSYDGGRYLIKEVDQYIRLVWSRDQRIQMLGKVMDSFAKTQDWTALHRQMEALEAKKLPSKSIQRRRRFGAYR